MIKELWIPWKATTWSWQSRCSSTWRITRIFWIRFAIFSSQTESFLFIFLRTKITLTILKKAGWVKLFSLEEPCPVMTCCSILPKILPLNNIGVSMAQITKRRPTDGWPISTKTGKMKNWSQFWLMLTESEGKANGTPIGVCSSWRARNSGDMTMAMSGSYRIIYSSDDKKKSANISRLFK